MSGWTSAKAPAVERSKTTPYYNIGSFSIDSTPGLWRRPTAQDLFGEVLGFTLGAEGSNEIALPGGKSFNWQQLCLEAIDLDPKYSCAYYHLATTLAAGGSIQLPNGTSMTQQQLYLKAAELNSKPAVV